MGSTSKRKIMGRHKVELTPKQLAGLHEVVNRYRRGEKFSVISGYAGVGKAQPIDTLIPTPQGWKKLGELKIGDYVYDRTGKPTKILKVFPQGEKQVYTLHLKDGRSTQCAGDHLWTVINKKNQQQTLTTEELLKKGLTNSAGFKYAVPNNLPVEYDRIDYSIDPYVIGAFLGDGCCKQRQLTLSSETEEIPILIKELIGAKEVNKNSLENYNWTFTLQNPIQSSSNLILKFQTETFFTDYKKEICCSAQEKCIPDIYKRGSINQRLDLLQGLFDTDGSIASKDENRFNIRFTSTSYKLILDVQEVLYSLGYSSTVILDKRSEKYTTGACYGLNVNIPNEEKFKLFRLQRKKDIALKAKNYPKHKNYSKESIVNIVKENYTAEMVCIYVDNSEHLYLTNDYIVTHNTTLVNFIIDALEIPQEKVKYVAFTGRAAEVLRKKGNPNATTIHKLIYFSEQRADGRFVYRKRPHLDGDPKIVVLDECSMCPASMWQILRSYPTHIIALGDPEQLPPILASDDNQLLSNPHVFLDEVMRQAKESDIIRLSMDIREGRPIKPYQGKDANVVLAKDLVDGMYSWADQILCATNRTRKDINSFMRQEQGFGPLPQIGDKVICLRNSWDTCSVIQENPLVNGSIGWITDIREEEKFYYLGRQDSGIWVPTYSVDMETEDHDIYEEICVDKQSLDIGEKLLTPRQEYLIAKDKRNPYDAPLEFNYGYACTVHRAQGSEWGKILTIEEQFPFDKETHRRHLYTAVTRASNKLTLVLNQ